MSVAFTKEDSAETAAETLLPDRPVSTHPNLVTAAGLKALEFQLHAAREAYEAAQKIEDVNERRRQAATPVRDARYLAAHNLSPRIFSGFVGLSGPYDFIYDTRLLRRTFSGTPEQERTAQPIAFVTAEAPRMLLVMGYEDTTVNPRNTTSLAARMRAIGAPVEDLWVHGGHGVTVGAFARIYRGGNPIVERIQRFVIEE